MICLDAVEFCYYEKKKMHVLLIEISEKLTLKCLKENVPFSDALKSLICFRHFKSLNLYLCFIRNPF